MLFTATDRTDQEVRQEKRTSFVPEGARPEKVDYRQLMRAVPSKKG